MLDRALWAKRFLTVAAHTLGPNPALPAPGQFRDDRHNALAIDEPFFAALAQRPPLLNPAHTRGPDEDLWLHAAGFPNLAPSLTSIIGPLPTRPAPLFDRPQGSNVAIEVYTERLLCAVHALWRLGRADPTHRQRCALCCTWLFEHLQPDNATNYPWAAHVMLEVSAQIGYEAEMYAETLLHNCQVTLGRADLRSAWILRDAGLELSTG